MDVVALMLMGMMISTVLVRRSSRKGMGIELTWFQAVRVVLSRGLAAVTAGFLLGRLIGFGLSSGWLDVAVLKERFYVLIPLVMVCGFASLLAFQRVAQVFSGKEINLLVTFKTAVIEFGYYVALVAGLSFVMMLLFAAIEFWPL
jgi:hypothetical protein